MDNSSSTTSTTNRTWIGQDGHMYRDSETARPFRNYVAAWPHLGRIQTVKQLKGAIRAGAMAYGACRPYYVTSDGAALCDKCTREHFAQIADSVATNTNDGWRITFVGMDNEVEDMQCDHCSTPIGYQNDNQDA
jgi:hypothetical protein